MSPQDRLAQALNLSSEGPDWGIEQADSKRLAEFIDFAEAHVAESPFEHELLAELILQSAQERLEHSTLTADEDVSLIRYLAQHRSKFPLMWSSWNSLNPSEWRVAEYLRLAANKA